MENKGYILGGLAFLLIIPSIILLMVLVDMCNLDESVNTVVKSDNSFYISRDIERDIPVITRQILKETVDNTIKNGESISNSRMLIRNAIEYKMNDLTSNYQNNSGVNIKCTINSVDSASDPFEVEVNSTIVVLKDNITYNHKINQNISILGVYPQDSFSTDSQGSASIPDPLPFIKCKKFGGLSIKNGRINYGSSLTKYLREEDGSKVYENASSPYYIRKCPYDPYQSHGNSSQYKTIKNCIDNGYYHESNDGSCLLCRLEGKSTCKHYGFETFVKLAPSQNQNTTRAPCSIDHVIFSCGNFYEHYPGESVEYYLNGNISSVIFLDNGHKTKYGV